MMDLVHFLLNNYHSDSRTRDWSLVASSLIVSFCMTVVIMVTSLIWKKDDGYIISTQKTLNLSTMDLRLHPHLPIITPRIEFSSLSQSRPPATITPRIDFAELWIMENNSGSHAVSDVALSDDEGSTEMDLDSDNEINEMLLDNNHEMLLDNNNYPIPKPQGEPGRPNSGGYNIENELCAWGTDKISQVMVCLK